MKEKTAMKQNRFLIFGICFLAYTSIYIARLNLTAAAPALKELSVLSASQIGLLGSAFSTVYAIGRLLNGQIGDRRPPWFMICLGLLLAGVANLGFSLFPPFIGIFLLWGINAYAQSMLWSSILCVIAAIYDGKQAGKMTSYMVTSVAVGNIIGIVLNTWLVTRFGTAYAFVVPGFLTLIFAFQTLLAIKKVPFTPAPEKEHISLPKLFRDRQVAASIFPTVMHGVMKDNISLWMTVFVVDRFQVDLSKSAMFVLFIPLIGFVGRIAYPVVYRLFRYNEHRVSMFSFGLCAVSAFVIILPAVTVVGATVLLSIIYAAVSMINTSFLSIFPMNYKESGNVSSISGMMDFFTYLGAGVSGFIYGIVIEKFGYVPMFVSWGIISVLSIGVFLIFFERKKDRI